MSKKTNLYVMNTETGKYEPLEKIGEIHAEQLTLDLDASYPTLEEFEVDFEGTVDIDKDQMLKLLDDGWVVDPDDVREELISQINKLHDQFLDGIYHVTKAKNIDDVHKANRITKEEVYATADKIDTLMDIYYKSCYNEYAIERDDAFAAFNPEKLN